MGPRRWLQYAATRCLFSVPCILVVRVLVGLALVVLVLDLVVPALVALAVVCAALVQHVLALVLCVLSLALAASSPLANRFGNVEARVLVFVGSRGRSARLVGC